VHYLAIRNLQTATLILPAPHAYFGMWWSAADLGNVLAFYNGSTLIGSFVPSTALGALGASYFGNPNPTFPPGDPTEKFAYVNFIGIGGTTFNKIVFTNTDGSTAFETDNLSIRVTAPDPRGPIIETIGTSTPEPSSLFVSGGLAVLAAVGAVRRRRALTSS
jgi:MYXO-CTERM domain-containing protein